MEGFADLFTDAFSETSVPPFPDEDLDFENLTFEEKSDEDGTENVTTNNKEAALLQEATGEAAALFETKEAAENVYEEQSDNETDEEDFKGEGIGAVDGDKTPEEDYMSSDGDSAQEGSVSGEDDEGVEEDIGVPETPGDLLMSVRCSDEFNDSNKEDEIFAEGQPMAPEDAENPQVRNEERGEAESDEDVSYFKRLPDRGNETVIKAADIGEDKGESEEEEEEEDISSDPECEGMKIEQEENVIGQPLEEEEEVENIYGDNPEDASSEFPCVSLQNLQELSGEGDNGEYAEKIIDFSGDEHQEAGESFADYPSDFSSCEYADDGRKIQESRPNFWPGASECSSYTQQDAFMEGSVEDITQMDRAEDSDAKEGGCLYSRDLEMDAENLMSMDMAAGEQDRGSTAATKSDDEEDTSESDYSSSDDDEARRCLQELENDKQPADSQIYGASRADRADFLSWDFDVLNTDSLLTEYLLTTGDMTEMTPAGVNQDHPEYISYSEVQSEVLKIKSPSYQGSLDDSFFFNDVVEASGIPQQGKLEGEDYEEERNWEQEEKRIKAFNDFYGDEENEREGRQIKVQFCAEPLSQVICYESDSDEDSLSTSTDGGREDLSSTESSDEPREPDNTLQMKPACDPPNAQLAESEPDLSNAQTCTEKHKGASIMKLILKMGLLTGMGLLMFWLATDQGEWLNQVFFF